jgi:phage terminase small subunit
MSRGGYRPNSGPLKGAKYKPRTPKPEAGVKPKVKVKPVKVKAPKKPKQEKTKKAIQAATPPEKKKPVLSEQDAKKAEALNLTPLEYLLQVMNDPDQDENTRIRVAGMAAPFIHPRKGEGRNKKDDDEEKAKRAGRGKFAPMSDRLKVVK